MTIGTDLSHQHCEAGHRTLGRQPVDSSPPMLRKPRIVGQVYDFAMTTSESSAAVLHGPAGYGDETSSSYVIAGDHIHLGHHGAPRI